MLFFIVKLQIAEENSKNGLFWTFVKRSMNLQQDKKHLIQFIVSQKAIYWTTLIVNNKTLVKWLILLVVVFKVHLEGLSKPAQAQVL